MTGIVGLESQAEPNGGGTELLRTHFSTRHAVSL